jgi:hypothetical protein
MVGNGSGKVGASHSSRLLGVRAARNLISHRANAPATIRSDLNEAP